MTKLRKFGKIKYQSILLVEVGCRQNNFTMEEHSTIIISVNEPFIDTDALLILVVQVCFVGQAPPVRNVGRLNWKEGMIDDNGERPGAML